jgi:hypothetical protein
MIPYEDLVVSLAHWRAAQGLPTGPVAFLSEESGNVDLALPLSPAVNEGEEAIETLGTDEVDTLGTDEISSLEAEAEMPVTEEVEAAGIEESPFAEPVEDAEPALAAGADDSPFAADSEAEVGSEIDAAVDDLFGGGGDLQDEATVAGPDIGAEDALYTSDEQTAIAEGFGDEGGLSYDDEDPTQFGGVPPEGAADPATVAADDMAESTVDADELAVDAGDVASPEISTEPIDVLAQDVAAGLDDMEDEATTVGIGVDEITPPDDDNN